MLGRALFASRASDMLLKRSAVVVVFHRIHEVTDADGLTITPQIFERYCRFFARHFRVIPLRALVNRLERGETLERHLAITFDDGYRDNFENAAPVLERLSLPATFFVVSRWIGSDVVPWWDQSQQVRHQWMTWNQVRTLHHRGFEIGAHTRTHADLGTVGGSEAMQEILGAKTDLENELAATVDLFAYPYGRRNNLDEANRELVKAAGFRCCCSSFGGINVPGDDPFRLERIPITPWYRSPQQFGFEIALERRFS